MKTSIITSFLSLIFFSSAAFAVSVSSEHVKVNLTYKTLNCTTVIDDQHPETSRTSLEATFVVPGLLEHAPYLEENPLFIEYPFSCSELHAQINEQTRNRFFKKRNRVRAILELREYNVRYPSTDDFEHCTLAKINLAEITFTSIDIKAGPATRPLRLKTSVSEITAVVEKPCHEIE
jgi:hypothetical protein